MMTRAQYNDLWQEPRYIALVERKAAALKSDGCSGVPDFYLLGCFEHDISYRTGKDPRGNIIGRCEADKRLRWYIQRRSPFGVLSPMSWWRWIGVRAGGRASWRGH